MKIFLYAASILICSQSISIAQESKPRTPKSESNLKPLDLPSGPSENAKTKLSEDNFKYQTEQFADLRILRYTVPGFETLTIKQKELLYYLYEAALAGRDIQFDQNYKYNLTVRRTLETIVDKYKGNRETPDFKKFMVYTKRVWFSNGIHHHYSSDKIMPEFNSAYFVELLKDIETSSLPVAKGETKDQLIARLKPIIFEAKIAAKKTSLDPTQDLVKASAVNFYEGVTQQEATDFYQKLSSSENKMAPSYGLNSKLVKENGVIQEKIWKVGGMYGQALSKVAFWLAKARDIAETPEQQKSLALLVEFYESGDIAKFDEYNIAWVKDVTAAVDVVNGFIEVYEDPLGRKGSFESVVSIKDFEASKRIATIGSSAQWFEDNSPIMPNHKKKNVTGISAKVINVVVESGDASPATPIGINLPNSEWIREKHGSKSVNLGNIVEAQERASGEGILKEFYYSEELIARAVKHGSIADKLHTDMHEVIGHASGQTNPGVGPSHETLKNYASCLEEGRADLVALFYLMDQKLVDLGVMESLEVGKAAYDDYITNGLMIQQNRLKLGDNIEEAHMRNRQLVAGWVYEKGKSENVVEKKNKNGKTYFVVNDYLKLRNLFGDLLKEIQRLKSEGDYNAAKALVEGYGVKVDQTIHKEVLERFSKLNIAAYAGFINPLLTPVKNGDKIIDVKIEYPADFTTQMMYYAKNHSFLPSEN